MKPTRQETFDFVTAPRGGKVAPPFDPRAVAGLAARGVFFGTSAWKYRGWEGMIYQGGYASEAQFQRQSLREYAALLPCVGLDTTHAAWPEPSMLNALAESVPDAFRFLPKATKRLTLSRFPPEPAYGRLAGQANPEFLDARVFAEKFLAPLEVLANQIGLIQFEFPSLGEAELPRFREFFEAVPRHLAYSVEVRDPASVSADLFRLLRDLRISPTFSSWTTMPPIAAQWAAYLEAGGAEDTQPILGLGIVRPGLRVEEALARFQPYREAKEPYAEGCAQFGEIGKAALAQGRQAYFLLNNCWEGSAPHSLERVVSSLN